MTQESIRVDSGVRTKEDSRVSECTPLNPAMRLVCPCVLDLKIGCLTATIDQKRDKACGVRCGVKKRLGRLGRLGCLGLGNTNGQEAKKSPRMRKTGDEA